MTNKRMTDEERKGLARFKGPFNSVGKTYITDEIGEAQAEVLFNRLLEHREAQRKNYTTDNLKPSRFPDLTKWWKEYTRDKDDD